MEEYIALGRSLKPIEKNLYNAIVRKQMSEGGEIETNVGPLIFGCGKSVHEKILKSICGDPSKNKQPLGDISDIETGRDFNFVKSKKGGPGNFAEYTESDFMGVSVLSKNGDQIETWLSELHDLEAECESKVKSYADVLHELNIFKGLAEDDAAVDEQKIEAPKPMVSKKVVSTSSKDVVVAKTKVKPKVEEVVDVPMMDDDFLAGIDIESL